MSIKIDERWEKLSPEEKMNEELLEARTSYDELLVAASYGNLNLAKHLIEQGTQINPNPEEHTATPLYYAAHEGHLEMVQFLVHNGADVNQGARRHLNNTALKIAIMRGHVDVVSFLLESHANVNHIIPVFGGTALDDALWHAKLHNPMVTEKLLKLLINAGADLHINGTTPEEKFNWAKRDINHWSPLTGEEKLERIAILERLLLSPPKENNIAANWSNATNQSSIVPLLLNNSAIYKTSSGDKDKKSTGEEMDFVIVSKEDTKEISNTQRCRIM